MYNAQWNNQGSVHFGGVRCAQPQGGFRLCCWAIASNFRRKLGHTLPINVCGVSLTNIEGLVTVRWVSAAVSFKKVEAALKIFPQFGDLKSWGLYDQSPRKWGQISSWIQAFFNDKIIKIIRTNTHEQINFPSDQLWGLLEHRYWDVQKVWVVRLLFGEQFLLVPDSWNWYTNHRFQ